MGYTVVPVSDEKRLKEFLRLPFVLYRDDPQWVPPVVSEVRRTLDPKRNPYFANAILGSSCATGMGRRRPVS